MGIDHFVGRQDDVSRLINVLNGKERADGKLTVQSIEGSGGIGKSCLLNHVLGAFDLAGRNYLTLKIDGNDPSAISLVRAVARMADGAAAEAIRDRPSGYYFPSVDRVTKAMETIRSEAVAELQKHAPDDQQGRVDLSRFLDLAFEAGMRLNEAIPVSKKHINFGELRKARKPVEEMLPALLSLKEETVRFWERLGIWGSTSLRNSIKEDACRPLADALMSDLSAILKRYRTEDGRKAMHGKVNGIDRLLLILDDFEKLQETLGEFLVGYFLTSLRQANFHSVGSHPENRFASLSGYFFGGKGGEIRE